MKAKTFKRRLKRKYLILTTIIITLITSYSIQKLINIIYQSDLDYKKTATECDQAKGYTCSYYEIRQYLLNK